MAPTWLVSSEAVRCWLSVELLLQKYVCHTTVYDWIDKDRQKEEKFHTYLLRYVKRRWKGGKCKQAGISIIPDRMALQIVFRS